MFLYFDPIQNDKNLLKGKGGQVNDDGDEEDEVEGGERSSQEAHLKIQLQKQVEIQSQIQIEKQIQSQIQIEKQIQLQKQTTNADGRQRKGRR